MTGDGMEEFFVAVDEARKEYETFVIRTIFVARC